MYKTSRYSKEFTNEMTGRIAVVLAEEQEALHIPDIQTRDPNLAGITSQKMARMLNHLVEVGFVGKAKGKDGRMVYKCLAVMEEQGYDIEPYKYGRNMFETEREYK